MKKRITIEDLENLAIRRGWVLISTEYINNRSKIEWECKNKHRFFSSWNSVSDKKRQRGCPICAGNTKPNIQELQKHAKSLKGKLISTIYINALTPMEWECKYSHKWKAKWNYIKNDSNWCPICSSGRIEKLIKKLLEKKLKLSLEKRRFYYDFSNKHKYYELDGYNEEYQIGFEYNGYQHYTYPNHCHKTEQEFLDLQQRDKDKEQYCKNNNILLIIIPCIGRRDLKNLNLIEEHVDNILASNKLGNKKLRVAMVTHQLFF